MFVGSAGRHVGSWVPATAGLEPQSMPRVTTIGPRLAAQGRASALRGARKRPQSARSRSAYRAQARQPSRRFDVALLGVGT